MMNSSLKRIINRSCGLTGVARIDVLFKKEANENRFGKDIITVAGGVLDLIQ
jgi:hypothetical protein